jgi:CheY-like chemotaxis protein
MARPRLFGVPREDDRTPLHALVIDDNPINRTVMRTLLAECGCYVTLAESGEDGVSVAAAQAFDVIVMDRNLPGIDGDEATRLIRRSGASQRAIVVSWSTDPTAPRDAPLYDGELPKPIAYAQLSHVVALAARRVADQCDRRVAEAWRERATTG